MRDFRIHTNWTNSVSKVYEFSIYDLDDPEYRSRLKWAFSDPERLRPEQTRQALTEQAAATFAEVAKGLREQGRRPTGGGALRQPAGVLHVCRRRGVAAGPDVPADAGPGAAAAGAVCRNGRAELFAAMHRHGGARGVRGMWRGSTAGLFDDDTALPLDQAAS